jgi:hypothetical protein
VILEREIKKRLLDLDMTQIELAQIINERFGERLNGPMMSSIIKGYYPGPLAGKVKKEIETVLSEMEAQKAG